MKSFLFDLVDFGHLCCLSVFPIPGSQSIQRFQEVAIPFDENSNPSKCVGTITDREREITILHR